MDLYLEDFSIQALVDEVVSTVLPMIDTNSNRLHVDLDAEVGTMHADQIEALHRKEEWRSLPIVVLTAQQLDAAEHERLRGYVSQVMQKGAYERDDLLNQVRDMLPGATPSE